MDIESKKALATKWFKSLRDDICQSFQDLDTSTFERKK